MNWRMGQRWRTHRWNLFHFKSEQPHLVPQGRNWTINKEEESGGRDKRRETRRKKRRKCLFPADPLARLQRPPRLLPLWAARWPGWAQTALLPGSILVPLAFQTGRLRRREERGGAAVSEGPARCHLLHNQRGEERKARRDAAPAERGPRRHPLVAGCCH